MPPPSAVHHLPSSHFAQRQRPKSPNRVLAEAEAQWLFTQPELANTPSIQDGMSPDEEREVRAKGVNFIVQVGILLKLPQLTLSTAAVFFQRFLMRSSLKKEHDSIPRLHHYQSAATALFLATKVEESSRKINDMVIAFCRVAQKNPNLVIDSQSKDWWKWRDCILHNEDVLLETLCFDLTVESPHRQLFDLLKCYGVENNKRLRNAAWSFVTDSNNTQLCLLCNSRTIATASLYAACKYCDVRLPDDARGRPWWEAHHVRLADVRAAVEYMCDNYDTATQKINGVAAGPGTTGSEGEGSIYVGLSASLDGEPADEWDVTRLKEDLAQTRGSRSPFLAAPGSERRLSNASSVGTKRERDDGAFPEGGDSRASTNGVSRGEAKPALAKRPRREEEPEGSARDRDPKHREEALRVQQGNQLAVADAAAAAEAGMKHEEEDKRPGEEEAAGSEEGEVEE